MWPTSVYNLGVGVALCSTSLIGNWNVVAPVNRRLWAVGRILHLPSGNLYKYVWSLQYAVTVSVKF